MTTSATRCFAHRAAVALLAWIVTACATTGGESPNVAPGGYTASVPPTSSFGPALRCMDGLLLEHGVRDLSVIVEDLADAAQQRAQAGSKDLLVGAVSDMTQRSRAIRLVAANAEWGQTVAVINQAQMRDPYAVAPQFALRGTLRTLDGGHTIALDLTLLTTQDMSVVPGTATQNAAMLKAGNAEFVKFGQTTAVPAAGGVPHVRRALAELAVIELFGRLSKVPYWNCLGTPADNPAVASEIQDWYDAMAARPAEIVTYFQQQLRMRQAYDGPIDGTVSNGFKDAVSRTREALGLSREPKLSLDLFKAYLGADMAALHGKIRAAAPTVAAATPASPPLSLRMSSSADNRRLARGEPVQLSIHPNRDAHVYCYLQDDKRQVTRFFPNRFQRDSRVQTNGLQLPGTMRFELAMNKRGVSETVACFATDRDVLTELPGGVNGSDFQPLPVASLDQVRQAFIKASGGTLAHESVELRAR